jgi:molecular chaperone GrpE
MSAEPIEEEIKSSPETAQNESQVATEEATPEAALTAARAEAERYKDLALRTQADFDNYRKRVARERDEAVKYANSAMLERLLPVVDNFELGLDAASKGGDTKAILDGINMVLRQIQDFLNDSGVQAIDAAGEKFDPNLHDAVAYEASNEVEEGVVIRQLRRGYKLKDRLLRPATVMISKGSAG